MSIQQMRDAITKSYPGRSWRTKVSKMTEQQVLKIYQSFMDRCILPGQKNHYAQAELNFNCSNCGNNLSKCHCARCHGGSEYRISDSYLETQMCFIPPTREEEMEENPSWEKGLSADDVELILYGSTRAGDKNFISAGTIIAMASAAMGLNKKEEVQEEEEIMKVNVEFKNRFDNTTTWVTKTGSTNIKVMTTDHLMNTLRMFCIHPERTMAMYVEDVDNFQFEINTKVCGLCASTRADIKAMVTKQAMAYFTGMDRDTLIGTALRSPLAAKMRRELYNRGVEVSNIMNMYLEEAQSELSYEDISTKHNKGNYGPLEFVVNIPQNNNIKLKCKSNTFR